MFRFKEIEIDGYYFINHQGLYWHSGNFWINEKKVNKVFNNGSASLLIDNRKFGIKKLRKQARPCKIKLLKEKLPF